eukprot:TRINITY_DN6313_c0_g1_i2.p1 TRINITY_DN6313_c0_g1~~TRINITY_DN6313_c0_g1_i2.p1  ORF type:complete len:450 (+),score=118.33 TRINITY_DN6313_c0_g1_i2:78-1427(+)
MGNLQSDHAPRREPKPETSDQLQHDHLQHVIHSQSGCGLDVKDKKVIDMIRLRERSIRGFSPRAKVHVAQRYLPESGELLRQFRSRIFNGKFSRDGLSYMNASQDRTIRFFDTTTWKETRSLVAIDVGWSVIDTDYSPDGRWLIYSGWCNYVNLCNVVGEHLVHDHMLINNDGGHWCLFSVKFSSDSNEILGGSNDAQIHLYDLNRRELIFQIPAHQNDINTVAYAEEGNNNIMISGSDDSLCKVWDRRQIDSGKHQASGVLVGHTSGITHISPKGDGRYFISNGKDKCTKLWDIRKMSDPRLEDSFSRRSHDYRFSAGPMYGVHPNDNSLMTYSDHSVSKTLIRCYFSPAATTGQKYIYTGSSDGNVYIYDILTGATVACLEGHESVVRDVSWHPYEDLLLSTSWDGSIRKWRYGEAKSRDRAASGSASTPSAEDLLMRRAIRILDFM